VSLERPKGAGVKQQQRRGTARTDESLGHAAHGAGNQVYPYRSQPAGTIALGGGVAHLQVTGAKSREVTATRNKIIY
jgi:hypothetical protein